MELENQVQMQSIHADELKKTNLDLQQRLKETDSEKNARVSELTEKLRESEGHVQQLLVAAEERDAAVMKLEKKARLFYEVVEHKSSLARILEVMEELSVLQEDSDSTELENSLTNVVQLSEVKVHDNFLINDVKVHENSSMNGTREVAQPRESGEFEELSSVSGSSPKLVGESDGDVSPLPLTSQHGEVNNT